MHVKKNIYKDIYKGQVCRMNRHFRKCNQINNS